MKRSKQKHRHFSWNHNIYQNSKVFKFNWPIPFSLTICRAKIETDWTLTTEGHFFTPSVGFCHCHARQKIRVHARKVIQVGKKFLTISFTSCFVIKKRAYWQTWWEEEMQEVESMATWWKEVSWICLVTNHSWLPWWS